MRLFPLWKYSEFFKKETSFRTTNQRSFRNLFFKVQVDVKSSGRVEETSLVVLKIGLEQKVSIRFPFFLFSLLLLSLEHSIRRKIFTSSSRKCIWLAFNSELEKNKVKMNKERRPLLLLFFKILTIDWRKPAESVKVNQAQKSPSFDYFLSPLLSLFHHASTDKAEMELYKMRCRRIKSKSIFWDFLPIL